MGCCLYCTYNWNAIWIGLIVGGVLLNLISIVVLGIIFILFVYGIRKIKKDQLLLQCNGNCSICDLNCKK